MKTSGNTILITGGATGIGLAVAEEFIKAGSEVIVCGRSEANLATAKKKLPQLHVKRCDVSKEAEREALYDWAVDGEDEVEVNFRAIVYLTALFTPHLMKQKEAAIVNVSSGLAFMPAPMAELPVYIATKAAIHSLSLSLRQQLKGTPVKVFELIPPMADTNLDRGSRKARGMTYFGIPAADVARPALKAFEKDEYEIRVVDPKMMQHGRGGNR
jgi:uncharacterized oxidoreductase